MILSQLKKMSLRLSKTLSYISNRHTTILKIAFWINEEYTYDHYKNVLMLLDKDKFDLVLEPKFRSSQYKEFLTEFEKNSWNYFFMDEVLDVNKYLYLVTHLSFGEAPLALPSFFRRLTHVLRSGIRYFLGKFRVNVFENNVKQHFQLRLGYKNFRFMYGADLPDRLWPSNKLYDLFFCHGPFDSNEMKQLYDKPAIIMGYPKYDNNFELDYKIEKQSSIATGKKTILWITTVSTEFSTIETYEAVIKKLSSNYNIILRPHPLEIDPTSSRFKQSVRDIVDTGSFLTNSKFNAHLNDLYAIADIVLADYGGSIFSAVYLDKRVLLLNHPDAMRDKGIVESNSLDSRKYLPSIDPEDAHSIERYISDDAFWKKWSASQIACREKYFGNVRGGSAKIVATYLDSLELSP